MSVYKLILFLFMFASVGCAEHESPNLIEPNSKDDASWIKEQFAAHSWRWKQVTLAPSQCSTDKTDLFSCVREACENAGGLYLNSSKTCDCSPVDPTADLVFTPVYGGACLPLSAQFDPTADKYYPTGSMSDNQEIKSLVQAMIENVKDRSLFSKQDYPLLVQESSFHFRFIDHQNSHKELLMNLEDDFHFNLTANNYIWGRESVLYQYLDEQIGDFFMKDNQLLPLLPIKDPLAQLVADQITKKQVWQQYDEIQSVFKSGCSRRCVAYKYLEQPENTLILRDLFVEGHLLQSKVFISQSRDFRDSEAVVILDRKHNPNLVYRFYFINPRPAHFSIKADVYKIDGEKIANDLEVYKTNPILISGIDQLDYPNLAQADQSTVGVCEHGFVPFLKANNYARYVFGPYAGRDGEFEGSIWGWNENPTRSPFQYARGLYFQGLHGYGNEILLMDSNIHHSQVAAALLKASKTATVTSLQYDDCLTNDESINPLLSSFPGKVVNLSFSSMDEGESCQKKIEVLRRTQNQLLWVIASGNSEVPFCEHQLMLEPNAVGVAAINPDYPQGGIETYARKGFHKVTTAAVRSQNPGTSFAAPVVAAYAADVFKKYPWMSPSQVKTTLTLGVIFKSYDVHSGGQTDPEKIQKIADALALNPSASREELLKNLYDINTNDDLHSLGQQRERLTAIYQELSSDHDHLTRELNLRVECRDDYESMIKPLRCWGGKANKDLNEPILAQLSEDLIKLNENIKMNRDEFNKIDHKIKQFEIFKKHVKWER